MLEICNLKKKPSSLFSRNVFDDSIDFDRTKIGSAKVWLFHQSERCSNFVLLFYFFPPFQSRPNTPRAELHIISRVWDAPILFLISVRNSAVDKRPTQRARLVIYIFTRIPPRHRRNVRRPVGKLSYDRAPEILSLEFRGNSAHGSSLSSWLSSSSSPKEMLRDVSVMANVRFNDSSSEILTSHIQSYKYDYQSLDTPCITKTQLRKRMKTNTIDRNVFLNIS